MYGGGFGGYGQSYGTNFSEMRSDAWINANVPGGVNSALGERLDNFMGGNTNPTFGQVYGGAPGVNGYGGGYGYSRWIILKCIRSEQVITLILSDDYDTPGQSQLFFSRFQIQQFTQLQALTLINIEFQSLKWIFPNLNKLNFLRSFTFLDLADRDESRINLNRNILETFRSSFWLVEKRWFVGYNDRCLFSIPHFSPESFDMSQYVMFDSTALNSTLLYSHVNTITLERNETELDNYFADIKTLNIRSSISVPILKLIIDLKKIKTLSLSSIDHILTYVPLSDTMPQLRELSILDSVNTYTIKRVRHYRFEQILKLEINIWDEYSEYIIEELIRIFPNIQYLKCTLLTKSVQIMFRCINGFRHLSSASFTIELLSYMNRQNSGENVESIVRQSRYLTRDNLTCRVYRPSNSNSKLNVYWWFGRPSSLSSLTRCYPTKQTYNWHRFRYYLLTFIRKPKIKSFIYVTVFAVIIFLASFFVITKQLKSKKIEELTAWWGVFIIFVCSMLLKYMFCPYEATTSESNYDSPANGVYLRESWEDWG
ncbi:hypothetical protein I4U23_005104 [Adineta vaga]|nr:hypothetical protein I4U23_005104 [Adineta vaga]